MWKKIKELLFGKAEPCFVCGKITKACVRTKTIEKNRSIYSNKTGTQSVLYKTSITCEGLCSECFDVRSDKWKNSIDGLFVDVFELKQIANPIQR